MESVTYASFMAYLRLPAATFRPESRMQLSRQTDGAGCVFGHLHLHLLAV